MAKLTTKELDIFFEDIAVKYGFRTPELVEIRYIMKELDIQSIKRAEKLVKIISEENLIKLPQDEIVNLLRDRV